MTSIFKGSKKGQQYVKSLYCNEFTYFENVKEDVGKQQIWQGGEVSMERVF